MSNFRYFKENIVLILTVLFVGNSFGQIDVHINSGDPRIPFPQFLDYKHGKTLGRDNAEGVTDAEMERDAREAYQIMMNRGVYTGEEVAGTKYVVYNPAGHGFDGGAPDVSEGDGYALLAMAYMADKSAFDGLFMYVNDHKRSGVEFFQHCDQIRNEEYKYGKGTVGWKADGVADPVSGGCSTCDAAADGDWDIGLALLVAYYQWPTLGITDDCGDIRTYKTLATEFIKEMTDTTYVLDNEWYDPTWSCPATTGWCPPFMNNEAFTKYSDYNMGFSWTSNGYVSGHIGFDGYPKNGNTFPDVSGWLGNAPNNVYTFQSKDIFSYGEKLSAGKPPFVDYIAPSYYHAFADFLEHEDPVQNAWNIHQYRRAEASSDYLMGELNSTHNMFPTAGNFTVNASGGTTFSESGFAEDSRHPWRTILNYTWNGNPDYSWDPVSHEVVLNSPNNHEYRNAMKFGDLMKSWDDGARCGKAGNDPTELLFKGVGTMGKDINSSDGSSPFAPSEHINWNLGSGAAAMTSYYDEHQDAATKKMLAHWYRQLVLMWDATDEGDASEDGRYIKSLPKYFHGWFRLLGLLVTTGNYQSPDFMSGTNHDMVLPANLKVYNDVDKTLAYGPRIVKGALKTPADNVTHTISYRNYSSTAAQNVTIKFGIPEQLKVVSVSGGGQIDGDSIVWTLPSVPGYTSSNQVWETGAGWDDFDMTQYDTYGEFDVVFTVKDGYNNTVSCSNASIVADNSALHISNEFPNNVTTTMERNCVDVRERNLVISQIADKKILEDGDIVEFTIDFANTAGGGWLNGGRSDVGINYAYGNNGPNALNHFFRFMHGAEEAYINPGNYRVSYFLNDAARLGLQTVTNPNGWYLADLILGEGGLMTFGSELYTFGEDTHGKWNQRLTMRFPQSLMPTLMHQNMFFAKTDPVTGIPTEATAIEFIHKGDPSPFRKQIQMQAVGDAAAGCGGSISLESLLEDDWSYPGDELPEVGDKSLFFPVTPNWSNPLSSYDESLAYDVTQYLPDVCSTEPTHTYDRVMIEEFDGYVWRRVLGRGPVIGVELSEVCVYDTIPEGLNFLDFTDAEALGIDATYDATTGVIKWCTNSLLPGGSGSISYRAQATTDCNPSNKLVLNSAWIESSSSSPIDSTVQVIITCDDIVNPPTDGSTIYKFVDKDTTDVGEVLKYTVAFTQTDGTIVDADPNGADWTTECTTAPALKTYDFSHGTNGSLWATVEPKIGSGGFSFVFRNPHGGSGPRCGTYKGVVLGFKVFSCGLINAQVHQDGALVDVLEDLPYSSPYDEIKIKVELEGDEIRFWINNENALPYVIRGVDLPANGVDPGYVGYFSGLANENSNETSTLTSWTTHFDSAFEVELNDVIPSTLSYVDGSITVIENDKGSGGTYNDPSDADPNELIWNLVSGKEPMLFGDSVVFEFDADVVKCEAFEVLNVAQGNILGQPEDYIVASAVSQCGAPRPCALTSVSISPSPILTIAEGGSGILSATLDPVITGYRYTWAQDGLVHSGFEDMDLTSLTTSIAGNYVLRVEDLLDPTCFVESNTVIVKESGVPLPPIASFTADLTNICIGEQVVFTNESIGTISTYEWDFADGVGTTTGAGPKTVTFNTAGQKEISLTVTGPDGTDDTVRTAYIDVAPTCSPFAGDSIITLCSDGISGGVSVYTSFDLSSLEPLLTKASEMPTVLWYTEDPDVNTSAVAISSTQTDIENGDTYYLGVSSTNVTGLGVGEVTFEINEAPEIIWSTIPPLCSGTDSINLKDYVSVTGGSFNTGVFTGLGLASGLVTDSIFDPSNATNSPFTVQYTYEDIATSCKDSAEVIIEVNASPLAPVLAADTLSFCLGTDVITIALAINSAVTSTETLNYYKGGVAITNINTGLATLIPTIGSNSYQLNQTTKEGCGSDTAVITIELNDTATATIELGGTYCPENLAAENLEITVTGGKADYTISYIHDNGTQTTGNITITELEAGKDSIQSLETGVYTLTEIIDGNGCISVLNETATIDTILPLESDPIATCNYITQTATIVDTLSGGDASNYALVTQDPTTGMLLVEAYGNSFTSTSQTTYSYTLNDGTGCVNNEITVLDSIDCGCEVRGGISLSVLSNDSLCPGDSAILEVGAIGSANGAGAVYDIIVTDGTNDYISTGILSGKYQYTVKLGGDYEIKTITDNQCSGQDTSAAVKIVSVPAVMMGVNLTTDTLGFCPGEELDLTVSASAALSYQWRKDELDTAVTSANLIISNITQGDAGIYDVIATGFCGTDTSEATVVIINTPTVITTEPLEVSTCQGSVASFIVEASGDSLTYQWRKNGVDTIVTNDTLSILSVIQGDAGAYDVIVTGECGSDTTEIDSLIITLTDSPLVTLSVDNLKICEGGSPIYNATGSGTGSDPLYTFYNKLTGMELQAASASSVYQSINITVDENVEVLMVSNSVCIDIAANDSVRHDTSVAVVLPVQAVIISPTLLDTHVVNQEEVLNIEVENQGTTGSLTGYTILWTKEAGQQGVLSSSNTGLTDLRNLTTAETNPTTGVGTTNLYVSLQDTGKYCPLSSDTIVIIKTDVTQAVLQDDSICVTTIGDLPFTVQGSPSLVEATETASMIDLTGAVGIDGTSYTNTTNLILTDGSLEGDYDFVYHIASNLSTESSSDTATIRIYQPPTVSDAGINITTCLDSVRLLANDPLKGTGLWTCDGGVLSDPSSRISDLTGLREGVEVTCTWEISNGTCRPSSSIVTIEQVGKVTPPAIFLNGMLVTNDTVDICITDRPILEANTVLTSGEEGLWATGVGTSITGVSGTSAVQGILTPTGIGQTRVNWTISTDVVGCDPVVGTLDMIVHDEPAEAIIIKASSLDTCENIPITIETAAIGLGDTSYWEGSPLPTATAANNWIIAGNDLEEGNNAITYVVGNAGCDALRAPENINIEKEVAVTLSLDNKDQTKCVGSSVNYTATVTGEGLNPEYIWTYSESPVTSSVNTYSLTNLEKSVGTVMVELISSEKCKDQDTVRVVTNLIIEEGPGPEILTGDNLICEDQSINIQGNDSLPAVATVYQWYKDGVKIDGETSQILVEVSEQGYYLLEAYNGICDPVQSDSIELEIRSIPKINASAGGENPIIVSQGEDFNLDGLYEGEEFIWSSSSLTGIMDVTDLESTVTTEEQRGEHLIKLMSVNELCAVSDSVIVRIQIELTAPNVFTVNGDDINETFHIEGLDTYEKSTVSIYNRWGNQVYESRDYMNNEWDGGTSPEGVYYFIISNISGVNLKADGFTGIVHMFRDK